MTEIVSIHAREILDSRGNPTVEADVILDGGAKGRAAVPSGASTGEHEAVELRDGDKEHYLGKGVLNAVENVESILAPELTGMDASNQRLIDATMIAIDGTENKSKLGANAILAVSMAVRPRLRRSPQAPALPLPRRRQRLPPAHAHDEHPQRRLATPTPTSTSRSSWSCPSAPKPSPTPSAGAPKSSTPSRASSRRRATTPPSATKAASPPASSPTPKPSSSSSKPSQLAGYKPGEDIAIALDPAASEFYNKETGKYVFKKSDKSRTDLRTRWPPSGRPGSASTPSSRIEDGLAEDDWDGWKLLTEALGDNVQLVGDDLFVTNTKRLQQGIEQKVANSILIKVNQIGTVSETLEAIELARRYGYTSRHQPPLRRNRRHLHRRPRRRHRTPARSRPARACRTDRIAKYNQLLRIEEELGQSAEFLGIESVNFGE